VATETLGSDNSVRACAKICILSGNHLCHNPRVLKEAIALAQAGSKVEVLGAWFDVDLKRKDQSLLDRASFTFRAVVDLTASSGSRLLGRLKSRLSRVAYQSLQVETDWQLGQNVAALKKAAHESDADLFIAHSEAGMAVAANLLSSGRKVGVDMEDWFSEDLLPEARRHRPLKLLRTLECKLLRDGAYKTCTSQAMGEALAAEYAVDPPVVIYNAFAWSERETIDGETRDRCDRKIPSVHWYSQTLGKGRGVEDLISALPHLQHKCEIHLRGRPAAGFGTWLNENIAPDWRSRVFVHDLVLNDELLSRIAEHDIGFAGEQTYCRSRDLTVTNKILHYLLAGLAVIASDTIGQREVAEQARQAVDLYRAGDPHDLATKLNALLRSKEELMIAKEAALTAARETFCWEKQAPKLLQVVETALLATPR
jgi:glycosyltransferase involved in cell wall biosynthesis